MTGGREGGWWAGVSAVALGLFAIGCSAEVKQTVEPETCLTDRGLELDAMSRTVSLMETRMRREMLDVTQACANILGDLGEPTPTIAEPVTFRDVNGVCSDAYDLLNGSADYTIVVLNEVSCVEDAETGAACMAACGATPGCATICEVEAVFAGTCSTVAVDVASSDPALAATLQRNLPTIKSFSDAYLMLLQKTPDLVGYMVALPIAWLTYDCPEHVSRLLATTERMADTLDEWDKAGDWPSLVGRIGQDA